jgi:hypothetical protein
MNNNDSDIVKIAWNEAQEKIKDMRTNYAIVVCHEISLKAIDVFICFVFIEWMKAKINEKKNFQF